MRATLIAVTLSMALPVAARAQTYQVDGAASRVTISVGKSGVLSGLAGHTHEVTAPIAAGSIDVAGDDLARARVRLVVMSAALQVTGVDEPPADRPKVQQTMESDKVLDVMRYPRVAFTSTDIVVTRRDNSAADLMVTGQLTIRDVTKPVTVPVHVAFNGTGLTANGRFSIKQSAFGIKPVSVAGVVSVKDALDIALSVAARR